MRDEDTVGYYCQALTTTIAAVFPFTAKDDAVPFAVDVGGEALRRKSVNHSVHRSGRRTYQIVPVESRIVTLGGVPLSGRSKPFQLLL